MTVAELIAVLQCFPPDRRVVTPGFDETDLDDVATVTAVRVKFHDERPEGYNGRHELDYLGEGPENAVLINF